MPAVRDGGDADGVFAYRNTDAGRVVLTWRGRDIAVLEGQRAQRFLERIRSVNPHEVQRVIAGATGRF